jgi:hypothetical protein
VDAVALLDGLLDDPSTRVCAKLGGLEYPMSRTDMAVSAFLGAPLPKRTPSAPRKSKAERIKAILGDGYARKVNV